MLRRTDAIAARTTRATRMGPTSAWPRSTLTINASIATVAAPDRIERPAAQRTVSLARLRTYQSICMDTLSVLGADAIDLRGENEVAFGEAVDLLRPDGHAGFAPAEKDLRMVALLLGNRADGVDETQRTGEIGELERFLDVMILDDRPAVDARGERTRLVGAERRHATAARHADFLRQFHHDRHPR